MSETMQNVRRTASQSMTMLKAATGMRADAPIPANELGPTPARPTATILSANAQMTGSITTTDSVEIRGKIEGDVRASSITLCAGGQVKGDLIADVIIVQGDAEGRIQAQDVRLQAGAKVNGEIMHGSLGIDTAADFEGTIKRITPAPLSA